MNNRFESCYNCAERFVGCHAKCEKYEVAKQNHAADKEAKHRTNGSEANEMLRNGYLKRQKSLKLKR